MALVLVLAAAAAVGDWKLSGQFPFVSLGTAILRAAPSVVAVLPGLSDVRRRRWYDTLKLVFQA